MQHEAVRRLSSELVVTMVFGERADEFDPSVIERLVAMTECVPFPAGETLFSEGDPFEFTYLLVDGRVRLDRRGAAPIVQARPGPLGAFPYGDERPLSRGAVTLEPTTVLRAPTESVLDLLEEAFPFALHALTTGIGQVHELLDAVTGPVRFPELAPARTVSLPADDLDLVERILFLRDVDGLRLAGVQTLVDLAKATKETRVDAGELLYGPGLRDDVAYVVADGDIVTTREGSRAELHFHRGSVVNWGPALTSGGKGWTARATDPARLLRFRMLDWSDAMEEHFSLRLSTLNAVTDDYDRLLSFLSESRGGLTLDGARPRGATPGHPP